MSGRPPRTDLFAALTQLLQEDGARMDCLRAVQVLPVPAWIGAGFVRSLAWDALCGTHSTPSDVDVLWFGDAPAARDAQLQAMLRSVLPAVPWSVKNQSRMHLHNGDAPYADVEDALRHWPETATAVAARLNERGEVVLLAPFGLDDLFARRVRPTPHMLSRADRRGAYAGRCLSKGWEKRWPGVVVEYAPL